MKPRPAIGAFTELAVTSNFSFLRGGSHPEELVRQAAALGLAGIAIAEVPDGPPVRFRWRRAFYQVARAEGPERIACEWWRDDSLTRDYFRVEDSVGHRFWLYREGLYGRELTAPRWYLHGVFA